MRRHGAVIGWCLALVAALWLVHGYAVTSSPPADPTAWPGWLDETDPAVAIVAIMRLLAMTATWYLTLATGVALAARLANRPQHAVRLLPSLLRPAIIGAGSLSVGVAGLTLSAAAPLTMSTVATADSQARPADGEASLRPVGTNAAPASAELAPVDLDAAATATLETFTLDGDWLAAMAEDLVHDAPAGDSWVVEPGDHLWAIAAETLAEASAEPVGDDAVDAYWRSLIDANRQVLVDATNPDLIYPGQVLTLPPVGGNQSAGV